MPIIKSAIKRMKQTVVRRERNVGIKRDIKEATKAFLANPTSATLSAAHSELDTAVKKNLLKKNTVARRKSNLAKIAKEAGVKLAPAKKTAVKTAKPTTSAATKKAAAPKATTKTVEKKAPAKKPATKKPAAKKAEK